MILKVFFKYGRGSHLGYVTWNIYIKFLSPFQRRLQINLALIGRSVLEEKSTFRMMVVYVYIAPGLGR